MKTDDLHKILKDANLNLAEPEAGHRDRFFEKLEAAREEKATSVGKIRSLWAPLLVAAASFAILFMVFGNTFLIPGMEKSGDLASVSPEMKETKEFYTTFIENELSNLEAEKGPETEAIIKDALAQMEKLEKEYESLKKDLIKSGNDKRVIYAMISNFQQRIDLLKNVLAKINEVKKLKNTKNESLI